MGTANAPLCCSTCLFCANLSIYSDSESKCDPEAEAEVELVVPHISKSKTRRTTTKATTTEKSKAFKQTQNQLPNFQENVKKFYELFQVFQKDPFVKELDSFINTSINDSGSVRPVCEKCQNRIELISDIMEEIKCFEAKLTKLKTIVQHDLQLDPLSSRSICRMLKKKKLTFNVEFDKKTRIFRDKLRQTLQLPSKSDAKTDVNTDFATTTSNKDVVDTNFAVSLKDHDYFGKGGKSTGAGPGPGPGHGPGLSSRDHHNSLVTYKYKIEDDKKNPNVFLIPMTVLRPTNKASDKTILHCSGVDHEVNMGFSTNAEDVKKEPETEPDWETEEEKVEDGEVNTDIGNAFDMLSDTDDNPDECIQDFIDDINIKSEVNLEELKESNPEPKSPINVEEPIKIKEEVTDSCKRKEPFEPKSNVDSGCSLNSEKIRPRKQRTRMDPNLVKTVQCSFVDPKSGECKKMFVDELRRDAHINRIHKNMDPRFAYKCDLCPFGARDKLRLDDHKKTHTGLRDYICEKCGQAFRNERNLTNHKRAKHGEQYPYICNICGSRCNNCRSSGFNNPSDLKLHNKESHDDGTSKFSYICPVCSEGFYAKFRFDAHMLKHAGPSFACDECPRKYLTKGNLQQHKLTHTGIRPFVCDICGWSFVVRQKLDNHYSIHTKKRPFLCQECGFSCRLKSLLTAHLKVHEKNKNKLIGTEEDPKKSKRRKLAKPRNIPLKANRHANKSPVKPEPLQQPAPSSLTEDMKPPLSPSPTSPAISLLPPSPPSEPNASMPSPPPSPPPPDLSLPPPPPSPPDLTLSAPTLVPMLYSTAPFSSSFIPAQELLGGLDDHSELVVGEHIQFISVSSLIDL